MKRKGPLPFVQRRPDLFTLFVCILCLMCHSSSFAQNTSPYVRIARIVVDSAQLENYKAALKEGVETAVRVEPGVISLQAVYDEKSPTRVTVFEVYAGRDAYQLHIQTPHFKKYKAATQNMVKSLELTDVIPIALAAKRKN